MFEQSLPSPVIKVVQFSVTLFQKTGEGGERLPADRHAPGLLRIRHFPAGEWAFLWK